MKKLLSVLIAVIFFATPAAVFADSPTTSDNGGSYDGCATSNIALAAKGCQAYVNGQIVTSLGNGTYMNSNGNVFDANGNLLYNANSGYTTSASQSVFHFTRKVNDNVTFDHFIGINVDGIWVDPSNYTTQRGSIIVTLKQAFLDTLSVGNHTITAMFDDSDPITMTFSVTKKAGTAGSRSAVPNTGETSYTPYWVMLGGSLLVAAGVGCLIVGKKH